MAGPPLDSIVHRVSPCSLLHGLHIKFPLGRSYLRWIPIHPKHNRLFSIIYIFFKIILTFVIRGMVYNHSHLSIIGLTYDIITDIIVVATVVWSFLNPNRYSGTLNVLNVIDQKLERSGVATVDNKGTERFTNIHSIIIYSVSYILVFLIIFVHYFKRPFVMLVSILSLFRYWNYHVTSAVTMELSCFLHAIRERYKALNVVLLSCEGRLYPSLQLAKQRQRQNLERLCIATDIYDDLLEAMKQVNSLYSGPILRIIIFTFVSKLFWSLDIAYCILATNSRNPLHIKFMVACGALSIVHSLYIHYLVTCLVSAIKQEAQRNAWLSHKTVVFSNNKQLQDKVLQFSMYCHQNKPNFLAAGSFSVDLSFSDKMIATELSILILILQYYSWIV